MSPFGAMSLLRLRQYKRTIMTTILLFSFVNSLLTNQYVASVCHIGRKQRHCEISASRSYQVTLGIKGNGHSRVCRDFVGVLN